MDVLSSNGFAVQRGDHTLESHAEINEDPVAAMVECVNAHVSDNEDWKCFLKDIEDVSPTGEYASPTEHHADFGNPGVCEDVETVVAGVCEDVETGVAGVCGYLEAALNASIVNTCRKSAECISVGQLVALVQWCITQKADEQLSMCYLKLAEVTLCQNTEHLSGNASLKRASVQIEILTYIEKSMLYKSLSASQAKDVENIVVKAFEKVGAEYPCDCCPEKIRKLLCDMDALIAVLQRNVASHGLLSKVGYILVQVQLKAKQSSQQIQAGINVFTKMCDLSFSRCVWPDKFRPPTREGSS